MFLLLAQYPKHIEMANVETGKTLQLIVGDGPIDTFADTNPDDPDDDLEVSEMNTGLEADGSDIEDLDDLIDGCTQLAGTATPVGMPGDSLDMLLLSEYSEEETCLSLPPVSMKLVEIAMSWLIAAPKGKRSKNYWRMHWYQRM